MKNTPEYDGVRTNLSHITGALVANPSGQAQLRLMYIEMGWLSILANPTPQDLVFLALRRIKENSSHYGLFTTMLRAIPGLDLIAKKLTGEIMLNVVFLPLSTTTYMRILINTVIQTTQFCV